MSMRKTHPMLKLINQTLIDMPAPTNINLMWNTGSLLGLCLIIQTISGFIISWYYIADINSAFNSISESMRETNHGWLLRSIHANTASLFFITIYFHLGRGIYFNSYKLIETWMIGVSLLILLMITAFVGYVLPWGQMSFWAATVITNLLSTIPYIGKDFVIWLWGGFSVDKATLMRFYSLHFLLPFVLISGSMIHLLFLHETGSNNPLGLQNKMKWIPFHQYFTFKDLSGFIMALMLLLMLSLIYPFMLSDPENFILANPLVSPLHIQPEWYFLFAYAILRSIPNKLGGVIALMLSVLLLYTLPFIKSKNTTKSFSLISQYMFWIFINTSILLTWVGAKPVEYPYVTIGQMLSFLYFSYFLFLLL